MATSQLHTPTSRQQISHLRTRAHNLLQLKNGKTDMLHTFVALVQDKPGVLTRVASLFRRLNINIVSLTVGESEREDVSRMTMRRGNHTSRVMKALGTPDPTDPNQPTFPEKPNPGEVLPTEFTDID